MWEKIKTWIHNMFTEADNKTVCMVKILGFGVFFYAIGVHAWSVFAQHNPFDLSQFSLGVSGLFTSLGVALKLKTDSPAKEDT